MELTRQIRDINDVDRFKALLEQKYGSAVVGHHQEQGIGVYELANGDEVKYWDEKKLIGNPFGRRGKSGRIPAHFTKTKYSEWGYKAKGDNEFRVNYRMKISGAGTLAYAKSLGLTPAQIRKAENEGIGNVEDIRPALKAFADRISGKVSPQKKRPNLDNIVGLHPSNGSWRNFLKDAELREERNGVKHYISSNGHYIVLPDGEVVTFYGYQGQNAFDRIADDKNKWLAERVENEKEIEEIRKTMATPYSEAAKRLGWKKETSRVKGKTSVSSLQSAHESRSGLSKSSDERQEHSLVVEPDDPRVRHWLQDPGSMDVRGIDTPSRKHKARNKRAKRPTKSGTTIGSLR